MKVLSQVNGRYVPVQSEYPEQFSHFDQHCKTRINPISLSTLFSRLLRGQPSSQSLIYFATFLSHEKLKKEADQEGTKQEHKEIEKEKKEGEENLNLRDLRHSH